MTAPPDVPDAALMAAVHAESAWPERAWSEAEFAALLASPGTVALGDARAVLLGRIAGGEAEVLMLATRPAERRRGLARGLLAAFAARAAAAGADRILLEVAEDNGPARALYDGLGWVLVGRRAGYYRRAGGAPAAALVLARRAGDADAATSRTGHGKSS
ncbi:GNAT family N-acetyltransferase [Rubellimicrobium sp. CFH 75288]|uniref:GNAT family N-acetyltransferase n=1 Tax=Rubellimicrobium sp. CFH 75288 TaxID=2697034 RepID=UPI001FB7062F|nr:GNAT family N-acetyltransferase [Rubellimicrobium sp. CFH 75288]